MRLALLAKRRRVMATETIWVVAAVAVIGCGFSSDLAGLGQTGQKLAITPAQAGGTWNFTLIRDVTACSGGGAPNGSVVVARFEFAQDGTIVEGGSFWRVAASTAMRPITGSVRLSDATLDLRLIGDVAEAGSRLTGLMDKAGTFTGRIADPAPGLTPVFGATPCDYTVTGTKSATITPL